MLYSVFQKIHSMYNYCIDQMFWEKKKKKEQDNYHVSFNNYNWHIEKYLYEHKF